MNIASPKQLLLSIGITTSSTLGGWALTDTLAGEAAACTFLYFGLGAVSVILALQTVLCFLSKGRVFNHLLFAAAFGLTIAWFMLCLLLPVLWITTVNIMLRIGMILAVVWLCICSALDAFRQVNQRWEFTGKACFARHYDRSAGTINWQKVEKSMKLAARLYIPGLPDRWTPILAVLMLVSMVLGLNLRKAFPLFSIFAWGIPSAIIVSIIVQGIGFGLAQARKVAEIEKANGQMIRVGG